MTTSSQFLTAALSCSRRRRPDDAVGPLDEGRADGVHEVDAFAAAALDAY
jgi:hypothetical protein